MPTETQLSIVARVLPRAEWPKVADREPFKTNGFPADDTTWRILVVEVEGLIVASSCIFAAAHWDGWQVDPAFQKHAGTIRAMLREGKRVLIAEGITGIFAQVEEHASPEYRLMLERLGLQRAPGDLYLADVEDLLEV